MFSGNLNRPVSVAIFPESLHPSVQGTNIVPNGGSVPDDRPLTVSPGHFPGSVSVHPDAPGLYVHGGNSVASDGVHARSKSVHRGSFGTGSPFCPATAPPGGGRGGGGVWVGSRSSRWREEIGPSAGRWNGGRRFGKCV